MAFSLSTAIQTGAAVLRVGFVGSMPLSASELGRHDARNPINWLLLGPAEVRVAEVRVVASDPLGFDLICDAPVIAGSWTLTAINIQTSAGAGLDTALVSFQAVGPQPFFSVPSERITSETTLRQALNAAFDGPGWRAFVAALGYSDEKVARAGQAAFYQRLLATAGGDYLERLTTGYGIDRPPNVRMSDDVLRQLTISLNNNKVNATGIEAVLLAYYGLDATVAHAQSGPAEPFALADGDNLRFFIDEQEIEVIFKDDDFAVAGAALAGEVAAAINRQLWLRGLRAFATAAVDPEDGLAYLRIYSGFSGIKGRLRFYGGDAERALRFPAVAETQQTVGTQWDVTPSLIANGVPAGRVRLTWVGGTDPQLSTVFVGDHVNIYGSPFAAANRGTFRIVETQPTYVEYEGAGSATAESAVTQTGAEDVFFVRSTAILLSGQYVAGVVGTDHDVAEVLLPATATAVERDETTGWYLNGESVIELDGSYSLSARGPDSTTVRLKTITPHGLGVGRFFFLDEVETDYATSLGAVQTTLGAPPAATTHCYSAVKLDDGRIMAIFSTPAAAPHNHYFFNPATDTWSAGVATPFTGAGNAPALVKMADGKVFGVDTTSWAIYDPVGVAWTSTSLHGFVGAIAAPRRSMALLPDGRIFVAGAEAASLSSSLFDPVTQTWSTPVVVDASRTTNNTEAAAVLTPDGNVVLAGGGAVPQAKAAHYNVPSNSWKVLTDMPLAIGFPQGVAVPVGPAGQVWLTGGASASSNIAALDLATMTWSSKPLSQSMPATWGATLLERRGQVFWVPVNNTLTWEQSLAIAGLASASIAGTLGPAAVAGPPAPPVWAFDLDDGRLLAMAQNAGSTGTTTAYMTYAGARTRSGGQLAGGPHRVTAVIAADILEFETPENDDYTRIIGGQLTPVRAEAGVLGSGYVLNPLDGVAIADGQTTLTTEVDKGFVPAVIDVGDATAFPDEPGYLLISFGEAHQSQPIRYMGIASSTQIRLDVNEKFDFDYEPGAAVNLLVGRGVFAPSPSVDLGVTWLTDSSIGRVEAQKDIDFAIGVGLNVVNRILYPGDRGLGNEGLPRQGVAKISDAVSVWGSNEYLAEAQAAREDSE